MQTTSKNFGTMTLAVALLAGTCLFSANSQRRPIPPPQRPRSEAEVRDVSRSGWQGQSIYEDP